MGTRSRIGVMHGDVCKSVYCHWDGYLEHNGAILQEHYDSAKANNLIAFGDLSTLRENIMVPDGVDHSFEKPLVGITVFYGRDRGEGGTDFKVAHTFDKFLEQCDNCDAEYYYVMENGEWYYGSMHESNPFYKRLVLLSEALQTEKEIA